MDSTEPPRLLDQVRQALRSRHYSYLTEKAYVGWIRRFILFHGRRHPSDLGTPEVEAVRAILDGVYWLIASLLHGSGLRLMECLRLRVKDIEFTWKQILIRNGKGAKDRVTMLAELSAKPLALHLELRG